MRKHAIFAVMVPVLLTLLGCGAESISGKKTMEIPKLGVSMKIPKGWTRDDSQLCHKGENTGMLMDEPLEGRSFKDAVEQMSKEFGSKVLSENKLKISGHKAVKAHIEAQNGTHLLRVYINKGDKLIYVSFSLESPETYDKYKKALLKSVKSLKIK